LWYVALPSFSHSPPLPSTSFPFPSHFLSLPLLSNALPFLSSLFPFLPTLSLQEVRGITHEKFFALQMLVGEFYNIFKLILIAYIHANMHTLAHFELGTATMCK
jgi:hypothetical protein